MTRWVVITLVNLALGVTFSVAAENCETPEGFYPQNTPYHLSDVRSKVSLVNLWAVCAHRV